jgi:large subunit ribosomal protein L24
MNKWIKKGDQVLIIAGNDKGKTGNVLLRQSDRVVVKGINVRKKHVKSKSREQKSGIIEMEMPLHISNVALCDSEGKKINLKARFTAGGGKELFHVENGKEVVFRELKKPVTR